MNQEQLTQESLNYEEKMPSNQHNWNEGGGWQEGMLATAYQAGFKQALEMVVQNYGRHELYYIHSVEDILEQLT